MSTDQHHARVAFVGAGPGDPGLLTMRAARLIENADAVIFDQICGERFVAPFVRDEVELVDAGYGDAGAQLTTASRAKLVVKTAKSVAAQHDDADSSARGGEQPLVVRLMDGDPSTFHGLAEEALACSKAGIDFEIVPGVSAVSAVPAYAGVPLTDARRAPSTSSPQATRRSTGRVRSTRASPSSRASARRRRRPPRSTGCASTSSRPRRRRRPSSTLSPATAGRWPTRPRSLGRRYAARAIDAGRPDER